MMVVISSMRSLSSSSHGCRFCSMSLRWDIGMAASARSTCSLAPPVCTRCPKFKTAKAPWLSTYTPANASGDLVTWASLTPWAFPPICCLFLSTVTAKLSCRFRLQARQVRISSNFGCSSRHVPTKVVYFVPGVFSSAGVITGRAVKNCICKRCRRGGAY